MGALSACIEHDSEHKSFRYYWKNAEVSRERPRSMRDVFRGYIQGSVRPYVRSTVVASILQLITLRRLPFWR